MSYYLLDNPNPHAQQYRAGRRGRLTGGVLLHTTESAWDRGAEPVARWIATGRRDYGSYHCIVDADGAILMAPDDYETWHCAVRGFNQATWGISIAGRTTDLDPDDDWTKRVFRQLAVQLVEFWRRNGIDPAAGAAFRNPQDLLNGPGLANHGDAQPGDRSDAFARHPRRADLERLLITEIANIITPNPGVTAMNKPYLCRFGTEPHVWLCWTDTPFRIHIKTIDHVNVLKYIGVEDKGVIHAVFKNFSSAIQGG